MEETPWMLNIDARAPDGKQTSVPNLTEKMFPPGRYDLSFTP
jgi:hypothetical protein